MIKEFGTFANALDAQISAVLGFLTRTEGVKKKKFKNSYAGWIWAASGTSLFRSPVDLAWIFTFFQKMLHFRK